MSLIQGTVPSDSPFTGMLGVLSCDVTARQFGPVRRNATKGSHDAGWRPDRPSPRRGAVLAADMLGAD
jgi:hypothetical protein